MLVLLKGLGFLLQKLYISSKLWFMGCWKAVFRIMFVEMKGKLLGSCLRRFCMTRWSWGKVCQACGARLRELRGPSRVSQGLFHSEGKWLSRGAERFWRELRTDRGLPCLLPQSVSLLCLFSISAGDVVQSHTAHPLSCINPFLQLHKSTPTPC